MRRWALAAIVAASLAGAAFLLRPRPAPPRTVVLVVLDTVRADHLPMGGAPEERAPWMAALARRSAVFHNAFSTSSWTAPSTASMFTGLYPPQHGVTEGFRAQQRSAGAKIELDDPDIQLRSMPPERQTLPERFQAAGWHTVGVSNNLNIGPELGFDRGFDQFRSDRNADGADLAETLVEWMGAAAADSAPTFEYIHLNDAHHPYKARAPYYRKPKDKALEDQARYDSEIRYMDQVLADLAADLRWDDSTAIVIVSDHGEAFGEHGDEGHIFSLYGEVNRVGMLVHAPQQIPASAIEANASLIDLLPTLLDLAGLPVGDGPGRSLLPLARGQTEGFADRVLFAHRGSPRQKSTLWASIQGPWKLIDDEGALGTYQLFDLAADRGEERDLREAEPERVRALAGPLDAFRAQPARTDGPDVSVPVDDHLYDQLQQLGYVQ